ncbi:YsnF/AvaK domain-containing protein [uncultured Amnibacterium sp.]|uniref:YsnF/AvaK domain-containing protein n=1 Tax=uncultured Amnibacterium sp. TaxID=1631851 RepID=UPI0035CA0FA7
MISTNDIDRISTAKVIDRDGDKVGSVGQVYVSDDGAQPLFVTVHTGLFGTSESFVPLQGADFTDGELRVAYDKATIKGAPNVDADGAISDDEQGTIFDYYDGHGAGTASGVGGSPAGLTETDTAATGRLDTEGTVGHDTSGPNTDDAFTRSEERLRVGTQQVESGRVRLRKHVVTEQQTVTVPVSHEEVRLEREPITDANRGDALSGPDLSEEEHEVVLTEERPVVQKETVPVERVKLATETVTEQQQVTENVAHEEIDTDIDRR